MTEDKPVTTLPIDNPSGSTTALFTMSSIDLNILIKFVPRFDGTREKLNAFLNNCSNAIKLASATQQDVLFKYILSQLEGRAEAACTIKEFENWVQLEQFLKAQFGERKHYAHLLSDLQDCRQNNETVNQFALRLESCLAQLLTEINISIPTKKKGELAGRLAAMQDLAMHTFVIGLKPKLSMVVRCQNPETLNEAINLAVSEEKLLQSAFNRGHAANCPLTQSRPSWQKKKEDHFKPQVHTMSTSTASSQRASSSKNYESQNISCKYCRSVGHSIDQCIKLAHKKKNENFSSKSPRASVNFAGEDTTDNASCQDDDDINQSNDCTDDDNCNCDLN